MPTREIRLDLTKPLSAQPDRGHNRWHPDITPVLRVQPGDEVVLDTLDAVDAQLDPERGAEQLAGVSLNRVHPLTGPIAVEGAEPGDVLAVEVLECSPAAWGLHRADPRLRVSPSVVPRTVHGAVGARRRSCGLRGSASGADPRDAPFEICAPDHS